MTKAAPRPMITRSAISTCALVGERRCQAAECVDDEPGDERAPAPESVSQRSGRDQ